MPVMRVIKFALQDIFRNFSLSFMTVLILILMLLSINALLIVRVLTNESIATVKDQIDVSVYFNASAKEEAIDEVKSYVKSFPEVTNMTYLTKEQVFENFKKIHEGNTEILAALQELGDNPLGPTLIIKTREPKDYQKIIDALNIPEYEKIIEAKTFGDTQKAIERIQVITNQVERFSLALSILFAVIGFTIIFNTIRVSIYTQRSEISIKRLVGATNWFIRGPYIVEILMFSLVSVAVSYAMVMVTTRLLDPHIMLIFQKQTILTDYFNSHILVLLLGQFGGVFLLTLLSSSLAMRKYLKV